MSFGENLERIRKGRHISQSQLGAVLGVTQQMISSYEKELSSPNIETLVLIADYFHISIDTLVGHETIAPEANSAKARFLRYFESLNDRDREKCVTVTQTIFESSKLQP